MKRLLLITILMSAFTSSALAQSNFSPNTHIESSQGKVFISYLAGNKPDYVLVFNRTNKPMKVSYVLVYNNRLSLANNILRVNTINPGGLLTAGTPGYNIAIMVIEGPLGNDIQINDFGLSSHVDFFE
jgi:hypothetical protein